MPDDAWFCGLLRVYHLVQDFPTSALEDAPRQCAHCQCILTVSYIYMECNQFALTRKDIFGKRDVVESFRLYTTLVLLILK